MRHLSIDIETYSTVDIKSCGAYKYAENASIMLFAYAFDFGEVHCVDFMAGERLPIPVTYALRDPDVIKSAHNAPFEIEVISKYFMVKLDPQQWRCTAVKASMAGLPMSLDEASKALGQELKDSRGKALIRYFCMPCKPTKANGGRTRNLPEDAPEKWEEFKEYCKQDVVAEMAVSKSTPWIVYTRVEHDLWCVDQKINARGWEVDTDLAEKAIEIDNLYRKKLVAEAKKISGLSNPNSTAQLLEWLQAEGLDIPDLKKGTVEEYLKMDIRTKFDVPNLTISKDAHRMLELRQELSLTSIKKYTSMLKVTGANGRARGLFQFNGAGRTGRWAGRLIQVQNLRRISMSDKTLMAIRELVKAGDAETLDMVSESIPDSLSQLIRTSFVAAKGKTLFILDFSAIEARVLSWLADQKWSLEVFETHGKIYEATAAQMLKISIGEVTKADRQKGKVGTLALGYQGGVNALLTMGALAMGLTEDELPSIVSGWRSANPDIVKYWYLLDSKAKEVIKGGGKAKIGKGVFFDMKHGTFRIKLPSGRYLCYPHATVEPGKMGDQVCFWGVDGYTRKWSKQTTYGGKLCENIVQAVARDCLANSIMNLDRAGVNLVAHVHDEIIAEEEIGKWKIEEIEEIMLEKAEWMGNLPLRAEGGESLYYNK